MLGINACFIVGSSRLQAVHVRANLRLGIMVMVTSEKPVIIRAYEDADHAQVIDLFTRINREPAPPR
jgi:hypothetical protein